MRLTLITLISLAALVPSVLSAQPAPQSKPYR